MSEQSRIRPEDVGYAHQSLLLLCPSYERQFWALTEQLEKDIAEAKSHACPGLNLKYALTFRPVSPSPLLETVVPKGHDQSQEQLEYLGTLLRVMVHSRVQDFGDALITSVKVEGNTGLVFVQGMLLQGVGIKHPGLWFNN